MAHDVFISYSSKDKPVADATCAKLEGRGIRCWLAPRDISPGADWSVSIIDAINGAAVMVLVFSANANASQQIKREVERAVNKGIPVIPLRIENVAPEKSLEYFISTPHWLDAFSPPMERHLTYLGEVIAHILEGKAMTERPPPPPPPWWRGPAGYAAGGAAALVLGVVAWFAFLRPPPSFTGSWTATTLDIHQFSTENAVIASELPLQMLTAALQGPDAKGTLEIDPSGQYTLSVSGTDRGTLTASPPFFAPAGGSVTFTSDITHNPLSTNIDLFNGGAGFEPGSGTPPDGKTGFTMTLMPAGQSGGTPLGDFSGTPDYRGTPDANGNMKTLDLIAGIWGVEVFPSLQGQGSTATATLSLTADGHYSLSFSLKEHGLWTNANGHWTRQIPTGGFGPPSSDGGNYTFSGRDAVSLYDNFGVSSWKRSP